MTSCLPPPAEEIISPIVKRKKLLHDGAKKEAATIHTSSSRHHHCNINGHNPVNLNEEDFYQYVNFRVLDSLGYPGAYKKFMLRRRDQGADWAIKMNNHVILVQHAIKDLSLIEQVGSTFSFLCNRNIHTSRIVASGYQKIQRPQESRCCMATCGEKQYPPIRSIFNCRHMPHHRKNQCTMHCNPWQRERSTQFHSLQQIFLLLVPAMDHLQNRYPYQGPCFFSFSLTNLTDLSQVYTRKTLEEVDPNSELSLVEIAQKFKDRTQEMQNFARSFHAAYMHVYRSAKGGLLSVV